MIRTNAGPLDRAVRGALGVMLFSLALGGGVGGTVGVVLPVLAAPLLFTAIGGWCPVYSLLGIDTRGPRRRGPAE